MTNEEHANKLQAILDINKTKKKLRSHKPHSMNQYPQIVFKVPHKGVGYELI